ncbi:MAG: glutathione S-transferase [Oleiphilaceae bacterium]|jgi:glutathione S-transferase
MITLFSFGPNFGVGDPSPFVLKIDAYMRMAGLEFKSISNVNNLIKAPKGKLPYIEDNGKIISDSFFILEHLDKNYGKLLDDHLSDEQKALSNLIIKSLDENFYWCIIYSRWLCNDTWPTVKKALFGGLPFPIKRIAPTIAKARVKSAFIKHGMGKHTDKEIMKIAKNTLESLSTLLSDKTYFFGDTPCTLDAVVYAFLSQLTISTLDNPLNQMSREFDNLVSYCVRINETFYHDDSIS